MALFQVLGYHGPCVCLTVQILISVPVYMSSLGVHAGGLRAGSHWQHPDACTEKLCHLPEVTQLIAADKACAPHLCPSCCLALDSCSAPALVKSVYFEAHSRF